jgi:hypothetical protein
MLAAFLSGLNISWCAMVAAVVLLVLDFQDGSECVSKVRYCIHNTQSSPGLFEAIDRAMETEGKPQHF